MRRWLTCTAAALFPLLVGCVTAEPRSSTVARADSDAREDGLVQNGRLAPTLGVTPFDDRVLVDVSRMPWRAVGRIHTSTGSVCTAVLVSPRVILTAAHCMFEQRGSPMRVQIERFTIGHAGRRWMAEAMVINSIVPPEFDNTRSDGRTGPSSFDYAFAILDAPLGRTFGTVPVLEMATADLEQLARSGARALFQAGFSADSVSRLSGHLGCRMLDVNANNTVHTDCDVLPGDSGSPLMIDRDGELGIIGVMTTLYIDLGARELTSHATDSRAFYQDYIETLARYP